MSPEIIAAIVIIGLLFILLASGLEIAWCFGITAGVGVMLFLGLSFHLTLGEIARTEWTSLNAFVYAACPLFIFMGSILSRIGVADQLFFAVEKWVGRLPGGLADSVIVGQALFGAMSGSSIAAVATFGKIAVPSMVERGYDPKLCLGSVAAGSILAPLIPPSLLMIVYGAWQGVSIVKLFAAGIVPGLMLAALYVIMIIIWVKLDPKLVTPPAKVSWGERVRAIAGLLPFVVLIIGVLGVIFGGIMTPTEAAAMGAFLALILSLVYRRLNLAILKESLLDAAKVTSFVFFIVAMAVVLSKLLNTTGVIPLVKEIVIGWDLGKIGILVLFLGMYLIMGCFIDSWSMLFITFPLVMPIILDAGISPVWWGVVYMMAGEQSTLTPPFGLNLFILHNVLPQYSIGTIARGALPFLIPIYINIAILVAFPELVHFIPRLMGF
ncbi:TRAP transporter large permease [Chloroflexota bacterium]